MNNCHINHFSLGAFETNCYILSLDGKTFIIDPGSEAEKIIGYIEGNHLKIHSILLTHAHIDHISGVKEIVDRYGIEVYLNENDEQLYNSDANALEPFYPKLLNRAKTNPIFDSSLGIQAIHTPGHTQGGTCFYVKSADILISGDTIFNESIGRTDLPGGNHKQLIKSIKENILNLPLFTVIYPGHGPSTSVEHESKFNPYF